MIATHHFLYNPLRQDPRELEELFVARLPLFERLYSAIERQQSGSVPRHHLIVGQRGMGKTMLLARLAHELRKKHPDILPLAFWEEHYIEVDRLSVFWLNCLDSLADALDEAGHLDLARQIDDKVKQIQRLTTEEECVHAAREAFAEANTKTARRLVLFIDNFNLLLGRLKKHDHVLRSFFTRHGAPIIVGAAITPPADLADYDAAFYDGFETTLLHRLSLDETKDMILRLSEVYHQPEAASNLWRELPRLAALRELSGGNPRTTLLIYRLCAKGFSDDIYRDLEALLDETTPLFQSRFDQLSEQGQKLVARLARHWWPATAETITEMTGFPRGTVSPLLGRLEADGIVEKVPLFDPGRRDAPKKKPGGMSKRFGYQLSERFFNIWIIMRSASRRERAGIVCLSRFLESIYSPDERAHYAEELRSRSKLSWNDAIRARALAEVDSHADLRIRSEITLLECAKRGDGDLEGLIESSSIDKKAHELVNLKQVVRAAVPADASIDPDEFVDLVLSSLSMLIPNGLSRYVITAVERSDAIDVEQVASELQDIASHFVAYIGKDSLEWLQTRIATGLLSDSENREEMEAALKTAKSPGSLRFLGEAAMAKNPDLAELAFKRAIEIKVDDAEVWAQLGTLYQSNADYLAARSAYARAIELGASTAIVYANYGELLGLHFGKLKEAADLLREAAKINPRDPVVAKNLGAFLWFQGGEENAEAAIREFERAGALDLSDPKPWINIGAVYHQVLGDFAKAETNFRKAISMTPKAPRARTHLGFLLLNAYGRFSEAEEQFRKAIAEGSDDAWSWLGLATVLSDHKNEYAESLSVLHDALEIDPKSHLAWSRVGLIQAIYLSEFDQARVAYRKAIDLALTEKERGSYYSSLGTLEYDQFHNLEEAERCFKKAIELSPGDDCARHNYAFLLRDSLGKASAAREILDHLAQPDQWKDTQALHRALFAAHEQNWGMAMQALRDALTETKDRGIPRSSLDDWYRASAVLLKLGLGRQLVDFLRGEGQDERLLPWFAAVEAHVVGDRQMLINLPAEARDAAGNLFDEIEKRLPLVRPVESKEH